MPIVVSRARLLALLGLLALAPLAVSQTMEIVTGQGRFVDVPGTTIGLQPGAIAAAPDGYLYVSDINGKLMRLRMSDDLVTALPATLGGLNHNLGYTYGLAIDSFGNPHVYSQGALHRIDPDGSLTNVGAAWSGPMAFAPDGNLYIVPGDSRVYRRDPSGAVEPYAGGEESGFGGDGGPASAALFSTPDGLAVAANGDIYVSDSGNNRIRVISAADGTISTFAGNGNSGSPSNGQHALLTSIVRPRGLTFDAAGNLYVASGYRILRIDGVSRLVTVVGGNGSATMSGDGGSALAAGISAPRYIAVSATGDVYFSDQGSGGHYLRKISSASGIVTRVMGYEHYTYCGEENGPAHEACLTQPWGLATNQSGNLFISDISVRRIRRVIIGGVPNDWISTYQQLTESPNGVEFDAAGNLYGTTFGQRVFRIDASNGLMTTVAGGNGSGSSGDGGAATAARLSGPSDVAFDAAGNLYISDGGNNRVRRVEADTGIISTYALVSSPNTIEFDPAGNLLVSSGCTLRKIDVVTRAVTTVAGTGTCWSSDIPGGTPATTTHIGSTTAFAFDPAGNIYLGWYEQIYRIDASTGIINRIPVPGGALTTPEGLRLRRPGRMETDRAGNLYISQDVYPNRYVFKVTGLVDSTPPLITPYVVGTAGTGGWYRSNVQVYFNYTDYESTPSAVGGTCTGGWVTEDTAGISYTCTVTSLGGTATETVTVRRDTVAPTLTFGAVDPAPDAAGWNSTDVSIPFTTSDALSGVYSTSVANPIVISIEGVRIQRAVEVTDFAGNSASFSTQEVNIDRTGPVITPNVSGTLGTNGWYTSNVQVSWDIDNIGAPVNTTTGCDTTVVTSDTEGVTFTCTATSAGGTNTQSVTIRRDATAPRLEFGVPSPAANAAGWHGGDVSIAFTATDATSGVGSTSNASPVLISGVGANRSVDVVVSDNAGNTATFATPGVNIDRSAPEVAANVSGTLGANGWYTSDVQITWTTADDHAPIDSAEGCAASVVAADTAGVTFTCTAASAGGLTTQSVTVKRDATPPVLTFGNPSPTPNANGWNKTNVSIPFTHSDALSGLASTSTTSPLVLSTEGAAVTGQVVVADNAGNSLVYTSIARNIDKSVPVVTFATPAEGATYGFYQDVAADYACADTSLLSCTAPTPDGGLINTRTAGSRTFRVTAKDLVNFTTSETHYFEVESEFRFGGFLGPVSLPPTLNLVSRGALVPIRWQLPDGQGGFLTNTASFSSATVGSLTCGSAPVVPLNDTADAPAGISFDAATSSFIYNWQTGSSWTGCRKLTIKLKDNSTRELRFRFQ